MNEQLDGHLVDVRAIELPDRTYQNLVIKAAYTFRQGRFYTGTLGGPIPPFVQGKGSGTWMAEGGAYETRDEATADLERFLDPQASRTRASHKANLRTPSRPAIRA